MKTKLLIAAGALIILLSFGYTFFYKIETESIEEIITENQTLIQKQSKNPKQVDAPAAKPLPRAVIPGKKTIKPLMKEDIRPDIPRPSEDLASAEPADIPEHIENIKSQIYALNIEYAEQIEQLDDLVQTGNTDTREYWGDDWNSVDDWKKRDNGFQLEKTKDGRLIFSPDEQTARTYTFFENPLAYTYDEEHKEFVSEIDYYGKPIYNVAKFISDDVLVMMTISGRKVDLNIYRKNTGRP